MRVKLIVLIIIVGVVGTAMYLNRATDGPGNEITEWFEVKQGPLRISLTEKGTLKAKSYIKIETTLDNGGQISYMIAEGSKVKAGDVLVRFDQEQLDNKITAKKSEILNLKSKLEAAQTNLTVQKAENAKAISTAKYKHTIAVTEQEKYLNGDKIRGQRNVDLLVEQKKSIMERAKIKYEQMPELLEEGFVTAEQVEEERLNWKTAKINYETALLEKDLYEKYTAPVEKRKKEMDVENALIDLDSTKKKLNSQLLQKQANIEQEKTKLTTAEKELKKFEAELTKTVIKSKNTGVILYGDPNKSSGRGKDDGFSVGSKVRRGQTIMTIPDISQMVIAFQVHEADIGKMQKGQKTFITSNTYKGTSFSGKIVKIASVAASSSWWNRGQAKKFDVESSMDTKDLQFKPGVTAKIEITIEDLVDVIYVPSQCIYVEKGKYYCMIKDGATYKRTEVKVGKSNDNFIEITEGLTAGQQVALYKLEDFGAVKGKPSQSQEAKPKADNSKPRTRDSQSEKRSEGRQSRGKTGAHDSGEQSRSRKSRGQSKGQSGSRKQRKPNK